MPSCDVNIVYMNIACEISKMSYANRLKVGAIIVKNNSIISYGYNGMPYGFDNVCETNDVTNREVLHAETNAIAKLCKSNQTSDDASLYVTNSPCYECSKLIIQVGIKNVYYKDLYRNTDGLNLLKEAKVNVFQIR